MRPGVKLCIVLQERFAAFPPVCRPDGIEPEAHAVIIREGKQLILLQLQIVDGEKIPIGEEIVHMIELPNAGQDQRCKALQIDGIIDKELAVIVIDDRRIGSAAHRALKQLFHLAHVRILDERLIILQNKTGFLDVVLVILRLVAGRS